MTAKRKNKEEGEEKEEDEMGTMGKVKSIVIKATYMSRVHDALKVYAYIEDSS
jgi:hypothetical protein